MIPEEKNRLPLYQWSDEVVLIIERRFALSVRVSELSPEMTDANPAIIEW